MPKPPLDAFSSDPARPDPQAPKAATAQRGDRADLALARALHACANAYPSEYLDQTMRCAALKAVLKEAGIEAQIFMRGARTDANQPEQSVFCVHVENQAVPQGGWEQAAREAGVLAGEEPIAWAGPARDAAGLLAWLGQNYSLSQPQSRDVAHLQAMMRARLAAVRLDGELPAGARDRPGPRL